MRRLLWTGLIAALAWLLGRALRPAPFRHAELAAVGRGDHFHADLTWGYRLGARPICVIFDLADAVGAIGSLTTDGEQTVGTIPLAGHFEGPYTLTATATYRVLGRPFTRTLSFSGVI